MKTINSGGLSVLLLCAGSLNCLTGKALEKYDDARRAKHPDIVILAEDGLLSVQKAGETIDTIVIRADARPKEHEKKNAPLSLCLPKSALANYHLAVPTPLYECEEQYISIKYNFIRFKKSTFMFLKGLNAAVMNDSSYLPEYRGESLEGRLGKIRQAYASSDQTLYLEDIDGKMIVLPAGEIAIPGDPRGRKRTMYSSVLNKPRRLPRDLRKIQFYDAQKGAVFYLNLMVEGQIDQERSVVLISFGPYEQKEYVLNIDAERYVGIRDSDFPWGLFVLIPAAIVVDAVIIVVVVAAIAATIYYYPGAISGLLPPYNSPPEKKKSNDSHNSTPVPANSGL